MVTPMNSYADVADNLKVLAERFADIRVQLGYSMLDARSRALHEGRNIIQASLAIVNILSAGQKKTVDLPRLIGLTQGSLQVAADLLDNTSRQMLLTLIQFKLETLFRNVLVGLGVTDPPQAYYRLTGKLLDSISVADKTRARAVLQVPALIRNSLHSNGYHHGYQGSSTSIELDGERFDFIDGQQVECAGWKHIILAFMAVLAIVEEILRMPEAQALADPLEDQFPGDYS